MDGAESPTLFAPKLTQLPHIFIVGYCKKSVGATHRSCFERGLLDLP